MPDLGALAGQQTVTLQLGLERSMPLQQVESGGIKEHRGYLGRDRDHLDRVPPRYRRYLPEPVRNGARNPDSTGPIHLVAAVRTVRPVGAVRTAGRAPLSVRHRLLERTEPRRY